MANEQLRAISEILAVAKKLRVELGKTEKKIVSISEKARGAKDSFQFTGPKKVNDELVKNKTLIDKLNESLKKQADVNKKLQDQIKKLNTVRKTNNKLTIEERENKRLLTQQLKLQHRASDKLATAYSQQSAKLILLRNRYKDLATKQQMGIKLSVAERKEKERLITQTRKLDASLKRVDRAVGQSQRNVGNYRSALGGLGGTLRSLAGAFGLMGGAMIFAQLMRNGIRTIIDYGKANATLSGILQKTQEEIKDLKTDSERLGAITVKTANEVVGLQIAYARLGFSQEQIIALTESTIEGSIAMNSQLAETAELTGAVVNSMAEFSAIDAPEIMDVMSLATAKSALTFEKLSTGLPIVLGAANALNVPFTKVVATLGKLSDAGIETSTGATSLRNIFIESAKRGIDYEKALEKIRKSTDKLTTANKIFGKRAAVSALVIADNTERIDELDVALQNARGTAKEMAEKELDTLSGALALLNSAWQGVILRENEANGIGDKLKKGFQSLAQNLEKVIDFVKKAIKAWLIYKGTLIAISVGTRAYIGLVTGLRLAKIALAGGLGKATKAMRLFNVASKSNPIGALIGLLVSAVALFVAFGEGANSAAKAQRNLNKAIEEGKESAEKRREISNKRIQDEIDKIKEKAKAQIAETKDEEKIQEIRKNAINETIALLENEREAVKQTTIQFANQMQEYEKGSPKWAKLNVGLNESAKLYDELTDKIKSLITEQKEVKKEDADAVIQGTVKALQAQITKLKKLQNETANTKESFQIFERAISAVQHRIDTLNGSYERFLELGDELKDIDINDVINATPFDFEFGFVDIDGDEELADYEEFLLTKERMLKNAKDREYDMIQSSFDRLKSLYGIDLGNFNDYLTLKKEDFKSDEEFKLAKQLQAINIVENALVASLSFMANAQAQRHSAELNKLEAQRNQILDSEELTENQRLLIETQFDEKKRKLKEKQFKQDQDLAVVMALVNGASAVVRTFAELGWPAGIVGAAIMTGLTAVEIGVIKSQKMPAFKEGHLSGTHEGFALINDAVGVNYKEIVERKSGRLEMFNNRNTVIDMDKGDKVHQAGTFTPKEAIMRSAMALSVENEKGLMTDVQAGKSFDINISNEISKQIAKGYQGLKPYKAENFNYKKFATEMYILNRANKI